MVVKVMMFDGAFNNDGASASSSPRAKAVLRSEANLGQRDKQVCKKGNPVPRGITRPPCFWGM
jgi:hypothetical protein